MSKPRVSLTYRDAGVDIDAGDALVDAIKPLARSTARPGVLAGVGGFGAMFEIPPGRYREPVLVSSTDGVGTKLKLAIELDRHDTIGIDLVAMCVNDIVVQGAEPLFLSRLLRHRQARQRARRKNHRRHCAKAANRPVARSSAARPPRCPACTPPVITIWPALPSARWKNRRSSTAPR